MDEETARVSIIEYEKDDSVAVGCADMCEVSVRSSEMHSLGENGQEAEPVSESEESDAICLPSCPTAEDMAENAVCDWKVRGDIFEAAEGSVMDSGILNCESSDLPVGEEPQCTLASDGLKINLLEDPKLLLRVYHHEVYWTLPVGSHERMWSVSQSWQMIPKPPVRGGTGVLWWVIAIT